MISKSITVEDLLTKLKAGESLIILDVRDQEKFQTGSLELDETETQNIPYVIMRDNEEEVKEQLAQLSKEAQIVTICSSGNKAHKAALLLCEKGYQAVSLERGLTAWREKHLNCDK